MNREEFQALNPEKQEEIFYKMSFEEKSDLLPLAHAPAQLAGTLSPEELYLMKQEMDREEQSEIIRFATLPQLIFISDIDCWKKDRLTATGFTHWLETLIQADENRFMAWINTMDPEAIITGFKKTISVIKPEWEYATDEALGDKAYFTLDDRYYILCNEQDLQTIRRAIEILYETHRGRYVALVEEIMNNLDDEIEEEAYQKRVGRLMERGFPDPQTAVHIYRPISKAEFERFPLKIEKDADNPFRADIKLPNYPVTWAEERLFLDEVLVLFQTESIQMREGLQEELGWLSNKVIACSGIDFAAEGQVRLAIDRARCMVSIGLELLSEKNWDRAKQLMRERWLEIIFRAGSTELLKLRDESNKIIETYWKGARQHFLNFLDFPYEPIFQGLYRIPPQCFDANIVGQPEPIRDFRSVDEITRTHFSIAQIDTIHRFLMKQFPALFHRLHIEADRGLTQSTLFRILGTVFSSYLIKEKPASHPLSVAEVKLFVKKAFSEKADGRFLKNDLKQEFLNRFFDAEAQKTLQTLWHLVFSKMEEEFSRLDLSNHKIDNRYQTSILVTNPNDHSH